MPRVLFKSMMDGKMSDLDDRAKGMLVGLAVGDALGANLEFSGLESHEITDDMITMRDGMWDKGAWTDDTSMALCLADSLLARKGYDSLDVMQRYSDWVNKGYRSSDGQPAKDVGIQTRLAIMNFQKKKWLDEGDWTDQAGNGVLMRIAPVVLASLNESPKQAMQLAGISALDTHFSKMAEACAKVFAALLRHATEVSDKAEVTNILKEYSDGELFTDVLLGTFGEDTPLDTLRDTGGYSVVALKIAAYGFINYDNFADGMRDVIKLGGDTDTNGAIYGQLAGAFYGYKAIPKEWKQDLLQEKEIAKLAEKLSVMEKCPILETRLEPMSPAYLRYHDMV